MRKKQHGCYGSTIAPIFYYVKSEFNNSFSALEPSDHVVYKKVPALEGKVVNTLSGIRIIVLVHITVLLDATAKQLNCTYSKLTRLVDIAIIKKRLESHVVRITPDRTYPARGVTGLPDLVHLLALRE